MHQYTNAFGEVVTLPEIDYTIARRLKHWGVCDLLSIINDPEQWTSFFERLSVDMEFIVDLAYGILNSDLGSDEQQTAFASSLSGNGKGSEPLIMLSEALREAVIDFFPASRRDAIRQFWLMTVTETALSTLQRLLPDTHSTGYDLPMHGNGVSTCSELSDTPETGLACELSASDSTVEPITTDFSPHPSLQDYLMQMED